ncbi:MAG: OmpA family protein [Chitinophagaceae bacterium]|jgi:OOP family OmpA-OmpF porin
MRILFVAALLLWMPNAFAQNILNKVKAKAQEKLENIGSKKKVESDTVSIDEEEPAEAKPKKDTSVAPNELVAYRKFGFVRGSNIIYQYAFEEVELGDYPKSWMTDAGGDVTTLSAYPGKWLRSTEQANNFVDFIKEYPMNFTLEFDVISDAKDDGDYNSIDIHLVSTIGEKDFNKTISQEEVSGFKIELNLTGHYANYYNYWRFNDSTNSTFINISAPGLFNLNTEELQSKVVHVSLVRQNSRLTMYINTNRVFDIRNAFASNTKINNLNFLTYSKLYGKESGLYFSNIILAETASDTRKDLFVDGKYVTNSILFETNSDKIQPASLSSIGVVAEYLKANPTVKLKVVGHTDNVGQDAANLDLSARRAKSVVKELVEYHKIDASRLTSEGKGESQPIGNNETLEGRAKNRRVEFIKQ